MEIENEEEYLFPAFVCIPSWLLYERKDDMVPLLSPNIACFSCLFYILSDQTHPINQCFQNISAISQRKLVRRRRIIPVANFSLPIYSDLLHY